MTSMTQEQFQDALNARVSTIEKVLVSALPKNITMQKTIADAMEYSLMAGGKRLRPMLMLEAYRLFGGSDEAEIEPFMAAIEMIHTYSLVHDDLPAMDNDEYRRGRKTTHIVYGEDMGILAGDALLNSAYETAVEGALKLKDPANGLKALQILSRKAGVYGMVGGQVVDVELTGKPISEEQLDFIYRYKTSALLEASLMAGAALAGAAEEEIAQIECVGRLVGLAFQIQDDILDLTSTAEELGKPIGSDLRNEKTTYVSLYGMREAEEAVVEYSKEAVEILENLSEENEFLDQLIVSLIHRKK